MAGSKLKAKKEKPEKAEKGSRHEKYLTDQLEEKYIGTRTEVFSRISAKEAEIRSKTIAERAKAERLLEDAKGQAAAAKRKATLEEIGKDIHAKIIADAREEIIEIEKSTAREIVEAGKVGDLNLEKAVEYITRVIAAPME